MNLLRKFSSRSREKTEESPVIQKFLAGEVPDWLPGAVQQLSHAEGVAESAIITDALIAHLQAVAPEFIPKGVQFRTQRSMAIKIANKIFADAIRTGVSRVVLKIEEEEFKVVHEVGDQQKVYETFPSPWIYAVHKRLKFMARGTGDFPIVLNGNNYIVVLNDQMPSQILLNISED